MKRLLLLGDEAIAQAALDAGLFPSVAVISDSTFTHCSVCEN